MAFKKRAIPEATRRAVAVRYGCEPGRTLSVECHWCSATGMIAWHQLRDGRPSKWVTFPGLELDHLQPESLGGGSEPENIVLACRSCNRRRGARLPHMFLTELGEPSSPQMHPRKGREGKGREQEGNQGRSPHPSTDCSGAAARRRSLPNQPETMDGRSAAIGGGR